MHYGLQYWIRWPSIVLLYTKNFHLGQIAICCQKRGFMIENLLDVICHFSHHRGITCVCRCSCNRWDCGRIWALVSCPSELLFANVALAHQFWVHEVNQAHSSSSSSHLWNISHQNPSINFFISYVSFMPAQTNSYWNVWTIKALDKRRDKQFHIPYKDCLWSSFAFISIALCRKSKHLRGSVHHCLCLHRSKDISQLCCSGDFYGDKDPY